MTNDPLTRIINKREMFFWRKKIKLLSPKKGDILVIPLEADIDPKVISVLIKSTEMPFALFVPGGNASLMDKDEAIRFAKNILKKYE